MLRLVRRTGLRQQTHALLVSTTYSPEQASFSPSENQGPQQSLAHSRHSRSGS